MKVKLTPFLAAAVGSLLYGLYFLVLVEKDTQGYWRLFAMTYIGASMALYLLWIVFLSQGSGYKQEQKF